MEAHHERKSLGAEDTFDQDIDDPERMLDEMRALADRVWRHMQSARFVARTVTLKITFADFQKITRSRTLEAPVGSAERMLEVASELLAATEAGPRKVRLLGISVSNPQVQVLLKSPGPQLLLPFVREG